METMSLIRKKLYLSVIYCDQNSEKGCQFCQMAVHVLLLGGPGQTNPGRVGSDNPDRPVGLISTTRQDFTFGKTSWSNLPRIILNPRDRCSEK